MAQSEVWTEESVNGIDGIDRSVPRLSALTLQQPALHLGDGLALFRSQSLDSFDYGGLSRDAIVSP